MTVRIRRKIESDTLRIPELQELIGREVEIVVFEVEPAAAVPELKGSVLRFDDPFEPVPEEDWEALG